MTKQHINIGDSVNDKRGDPLRTAFDKVNQNFDELYNSVSAVVVAGATAPTTPGVGDLWYDTESGRTYVYYDSTWVDASPVDGAGINSTNELVNGNKTVSLDPNGLTTFPTFQTGTESLYLQGTEFGSVNSGVAIAAKNQIILAANVLGNQKNWNFGTDGKLTLPAGTTYEYVNAPLTGHGDGLARLDFTLVTDGVDTQWAAASASPAGSGYNPGDTFTFDTEFLGIPGASVTIEVLTVGAGGSVENLAFTQPPFYPADIYRDSPINLQVGPESNRWTFGATGTLTIPGAIKQGNNQLDLNYGDGFVNLTSTTDDSTSLYLSADNAALTGRLTASITAGVAGEAARTTYTEKTNELALAFLAESWTGAGYPAGINSSQQLNAAKALNPLIPDAWITIASELKTAWDTWQEVLTFSDFSIAVGGNDVVWQFDPQGTLSTPGDIELGADSYLRFSDSSFQGTAFVGDATRLYGNLDQDVDVIARPPSTVTATTTAGAGGPFTGQFEISEPFDILAVQAGWEMNTGTEQSPIWTTVTNANLEPGEYWIYLDSGFEFEFAPSTAYTFRNPTPVLRTWTFGTDGALTFPDNLTVVNGIIGKASTATITEGAASQTTAIESQIEITTTGVVIAKRTSVTVNDGVITTVNDSGSTLELDNTHASITYYIEPDGPDNNSLIQFTTDSSAGGGATIETVTEDVGGTAHGRVRAAGNSVQVSTKTFLGTNKTWSFTGAGNLELPESGNILSNGANYIDLANFETSYNNAEGAYQDALTAWMTLETFRPVWFALPGRLAYDEMILWTPTTGQPALPLNLPPVAKNAQDSYAAWQETIALSKLTVASDIAEFDFNSTGKLRLSQGGTVGGGDQADIDAAYDDWQADEAAWQYLITTGGADLNVRPWNFAGPSRAEKQAVVLSMWQAQQSGAAIDWVPISVSFYNEARAWLAFTANQDGYDEWKKLTTSVNIASEDKTWTFTNDGDLTLPNGAVINETASSPGLLKKKYSGTFVLDPTWFVTNAGNLIETTTINGTIQSTDLEVFNAFSFEFTGYFVPPTSANYTFKAHADETFIFWIGDKALSDYTYANKDMYGDYNGTFPEQQTQSFTIALTAGEFYPIRIQWANSAGWGELDVFTWANDAGQADTANFTGHIYTANTGTAKIAVNDNRSIILSTDNATDNNWTFAPNGLLTFPDGTTTTGKSITVPVDQSLTVNTSYSMGPGGATTFKISPEHIKLPTGNGVIFSGTETAANSWGLDSANKTLYFPDAGDGVNPQIYYSKVDGVTGMELMTYAKSIKITAAQTSSWTFGADGELSLPTNGYTEAVIKELDATALVLFAQKAGANVKILAGATSAGSAKQWLFDGTNGRTMFPNGVVPEHSYGAAGDKEGMVVFSDPYIYYCKQDYVDNSTDIWVRVAWTGTNW